MRADTTLLVLAKRTTLTLNLNPLFRSLGQNNSALHEVSVPAGPRLLILDHVSTYKNYYKQDLAKRVQLLPRDQ